MKSLLFKIFSILGAAIALFIVGSNAGKRKEQNKNLKRSVNNVKKAKNIEKNISKLTRDDKLDRL